VVGGGLTQYGVHGWSQYGTGVFGEGPALGLHGESEEGTGIYGHSSYPDFVWDAEIAKGVGVQGNSAVGPGVMGVGGIGVVGYGDSFGVAGNAIHAGGKGVWGMSIFSHGVLGESYEPASAGVLGDSHGAAWGVRGINGGAGTSGYLAGQYGAYGEKASASGYLGGDYGVYGHSDGDGVRGETSGAAAKAVSGSNSSTGNWGFIGGNCGVGGNATSLAGVCGSSGSGYGVSGYSASGTAVQGETDAGGAFGVRGENNGADSTGYLGGTHGVYGRSGSGHAGYLDGSLLVTSLAGTGNRAVYSDPSGVLTNSSSDGRLKKDVVALGSEVDLYAVLAGLRGVAFAWDTSVDRVRGYGDQREIGMIAQEVERVLPHVVGEGGDGYKTLDYAKLTAFLIEVVKAQEARIRALEAAQAR
jgi:hypothetical protein